MFPMSAKHLEIPAFVNGPGRRLCSNKTGDEYPFSPSKMANLLPSIIVAADEWPLQLTHSYYVNGSLGKDSNLKSFG